jgi:hypothetical protein
LRAVPRARVRGLYSLNCRERKFSKSNFRCAGFSETEGQKERAGVEMPRPFTLSWCIVPILTCVQLKETLRGKGKGEELNTQGIIGIVVVVIIIIVVLLVLGVI